MNSEKIKQKALDFIARENMMSDFLNYLDSNFYVTGEMESYLKEKRKQQKKREFRDKIHEAFDKAKEVREIETRS